MRSKKWLLGTLALLLTLVPGGVRLVQPVSAAPE